MNCKNVIREVSNYIDGDLDPHLLEDLKRHLEHCEDCTMIVDQTKKSIAILSGSKLFDLPDDVRARLRAAVHRKIGEKSN